MWFRKSNFSNLADDMTLAGEIIATRSRLGLPLLSTEKMMAMSRKQKAQHLEELKAQESQSNEGSN